MSSPDVASETYLTGELRGRKRKKTRWNQQDAFPLVSSLALIPKCMPSNLTIEQQEALLTRIRIEEITRKLQLNDLDIDNTSTDRSPSPEPIYDSSGKRTNTRDQRAKERLNLERHQLVEKAIAMNPQFKPPADYTPVHTKKMRKIRIPYDKYPDYNFIGLIIGPRGNTQKRMERETGCKIAIRGRGSVKDGKGRRDGKLTPGEDEPLHVLIVGDTDIAVEKASKMVSDLLVPIEEGKNEHKRQQLRELAEINGTLRDRLWMESPPEQSFERSNVKCGICGEASHPTSDCPLRGKAAIGSRLAGKDTAGNSLKQQIDSEYEKFLSEIGEAPPPSASKDPENAYAEFMAAIGETVENDSSHGNSLVTGSSEMTNISNGNGGTIAGGIDSNNNASAAASLYASAYAQSFSPSTLLQYQQQQQQQQQPPNMGLPVPWGTASAYLPATHMMPWMNAMPQPPVQQVPWQQSVTYPWPPQPPS